MPTPGISTINRQPAANTQGAYWAWMRYARLTKPEENACQALPSGEIPATIVQRFSSALIFNLYRHTQQQELPAKTLMALQKQSIETTASEMLKHRWLNTFGEKITEAGIFAALLKSSAFNGWIYPAEAMRHSVDIDLWVTPKAFEQTCRLMLETHNPVVLGKYRKATHEHLFERVFMPKPGTPGPTVEVHRGLTNPHLYSVSYSSLLKDSSAHPGFQNTNLRRLSPEKNLLNLALHASRDRNFVGYGTMDVHELWCKGGVSASRLLELAAEWQAKTPLYFLLLGAKENLDSPIPNTVLNELRPKAWRQKLAAATTGVTSSAHSKNQPGRFKQLLSNYALTDSLFNAIKFQIDYVAMRIRDIIQH